MSATFLFTYLQYDAVRKGGVTMAKKKSRPSPEIVAHVQALVCSEGGYGVQLVAAAVAVKGDARQRGPGVLFRVPGSMTEQQRIELSNTITNHVPEITRVLIEIECTPNPL